MTNELTKEWYNDSYRRLGAKAQRRYPNEELIRFLAKYFFGIPWEERKSIKILEVGSGALGNLKTIAEENFQAFGVDISEEAVQLSREIMKKLGLSAEFICADMVDLQIFDNDTFDAIVDVFSSYCLQAQQFDSFLASACRKLKHGGRFFCFTPSINSDAFKNHEPAALIESSTLNGIYRDTSPFYGNFYPFRFESPETIEKKLSHAGLKIDYLETVAKSYNNRQELFEWLVVHASKR